MSDQNLDPQTAASRENVRRAVARIATVVVAFRIVYHELIMVVLDSASVIEVNAIGFADTKDNTCRGVALSRGNASCIPAGSHPMHVKP